MELTGSIFPGGKNSRMGKEKGLCLLQGRPLIEFSFNLLKNFCDSIIISSDSNDYDYLECQIVTNDFMELARREEYIHACGLPGKIRI